MSRPMSISKFKLKVKGIGRRGKTPFYKFSLIFYMIKKATC